MKDLEDILIGEIKELKTSIDYNTKLLESIVDMIQNKGQQMEKRKQFLKSLSSMIQNNNAIKNNPDFAIFINQMGQMFGDEGE